MLRMIQSASKVIGYMSKYILESFWSSHSFSKMLVFLVLLLSSHLNILLYPKMHNDSVWLILSNWCFWRAFDSLESSHWLYTFLNVLIPVWISLPPESIIPILLIYICKVLFFVGIFAFACFFFLFLSFQPFHLSLETGLGITSFWYDLVNSRWLWSMSFWCYLLSFYFMYLLLHVWHFESTLKPFLKCKNKFWLST